MPSSVIIGLQSIHNPFLDGFFSLVTQLGSEGFYVFVIALLFWCVDKRLAFRLGVVFLVGQFANSVLKNLWRVPRP
ncbi:MAG: phospholipid phosphatase, partial [Bacillota bacterium]